MWMPPKAVYLRTTSCLALVCNRLVDVSVDYYALAYVGYKCSQFLSFSSQDLGTLLRESQARDKKSGFLPGCRAIPDQYAFAMYHMIGI